MCLSSRTFCPSFLQAPSHTVCNLQLATAGSRFLRPPTVNKSLIMPYNWTRRMPASSTTSDDRSPCVPTPPTPTEVAAASGSRNSTHPSTWIPLPSPTASAPSAPVSPAVSVAVECSDGYRTPQAVLELCVLIEHAKIFEKRKLMCGQLKNRSDRATPLAVL